MYSWQNDNQCLILIRIVQHLRSEQNRNYVGIKRNSCYILSVYVLWNLMQGFYKCFPQFLFSRDFIKNDLVWVVSYFVKSDIFFETVGSSWLVFHSPQATKISRIFSKHERDDKLQ
jgi:hypothetical protein